MLEVAQRLELSAFDVVPTDMGYGEATFGIYINEPQVALLRSFLKKNAYDCLIMGHVAYYQVPPDLQDLIIEKVNAGMGLIWSTPILYKPEYYTKEGHGYPPKVRDYFFKDAKRTELDAIKIKTPRMGNLASPNMCEVGKGRFAFIGSGYWGLSEQDIRFNETYRYWEYQYAAWAKLIEWAAHRDPEVRVSDITFENNEFQVKLKNLATKDRSAKVTLRVVDRFETELASFEKTLALTGMASALPSSEVAGFTLKEPLPAGMHFAQVLAYDEDGGVYDFGALEVDAPGVVRIASAEPTSQTFQPQGPVELNLKVKNEGNAEQKVALRAALEDAHGRCVVVEKRELTLKPGEQDVPLSLDSRDVHTVLARAYLTLEQDGRTLHREIARAYLRQPRTFDDFMPAACYGAVYYAPTYLIRLAMPVLRDIGIRVVMGERDPETELGLRTCPMNAGVTRDKDGNGNSIGNWNDKLERGFCIHDPEDLSFGAEGIRRSVGEGEVGKGSAWRKYTPIFYGIWDEPGIIYASNTAAVDLCWTTYTINALREDLKKTYGTLEALNAEWETDFTSWDSVVPISL